MERKKINKIEGGGEKRRIHASIALCIFRGFPV